VHLHFSWVCGHRLFHPDVMAHCSAEGFDLSQMQARK
jgi:hypothetical protein